MQIILLNKHLGEKLFNKINFRTTELFISIINFSPKLFN
jgi:hypothetical protein